MPIPSEIGRVFQIAVELHRAGSVPEAGNLYREILKVQPDHAEAIHLLGVISLQRGDSRKAVALISKAVMIDPGLAAAFYNLGRCYEQLAEHGKAIESYKNSLS